MTLEDAIKKFDYAVSHPEIQGLRYNTLFPIKNRLPKEQWGDFKTYLGGINHKYITDFEKTSYYER